MKTEVEIERVGYEGQGVGFDDEGHVYFVPNTIPGDRAFVSYDPGSRRYRDAILKDVIRPSPNRVHPVCSFFPDCGGCDWLHWDYPAQLRAKEEILSHVLKRAKNEPETFLPSQGAAQNLGYRNRIQMQVQGRRLGFFKKRSHDIVEIDQCKMAHPKLNRAISNLKKQLIERSTKGKETTRVELSIDEKGSVAHCFNAYAKESRFVQINQAQNKILRQKVKERICDSGSEQVLELYCGDGNLTFAYQEHVRKIIAYDISGAAIVEASRKARNLELSEKAEFFSLPVDHKLKRKLPAYFRNQYDTLVVDPPRKGMEEALKNLLHPGLKNIIYVSCSPLAFSKDIQCLEKQFHFKSVQIVDMFPHSRHIEFISCFVRS